MLLNITITDKIKEKFEQNIEKINVILREIAILNEKRILIMEILENVYETIKIKHELETGKRYEFPSLFDESGTSLNISIENNILSVEAMEVEDNNVK